MDIERHFDWGSAKTCNLTKRMAYRVATRVERQKKVSIAKRQALPVKQVLLVGLGQYDLNRPEWYPTTKQLKVYDDDWDDWNIGERAVLLQKLRNGADRDDLWTIFKVGDDMQAELSFEAFGQDIDEPVEGLDTDRSDVRTRNRVNVEGGVLMIESHEKPIYDTGRYNKLDFLETDDLRYANRRWIEYKSRVDIEKPTNQTIIDMMILQEIRFRRARRDMNSRDKKKQEEAAVSLKQIREEYSKSAKDVALLEVQFKKEPEQESLDAVILRTHDVREVWRNVEIENEMAIRGLFDMIEKFHRTHLDEPGDDDERVQTKIPVPTIGERKSMAAELALNAVRKSEDDDSGIQIGSSE